MIARIRLLLFVVVCTTIIFVAEASAQTASSSESSAGAYDQPQKIRLLVTDLSAAGVEKRVSDVVSSLVADAFTQQTTFDVLAGTDLRQMMELEATRQTAGCDIDASCLAEIAGALGAQRVVFGSIARLGDEFVVTLTLLNSTTVTALGRVTTRVKGEGALADTIPSMVRKLVASTAGNAFSTPVIDNTAGSPLLAWSLVGGGSVIGVLAVVVTAVGFSPVVVHSVITSQLDDLTINGTVDDVERAKRLRETQVDAANAWSPGGGFLALTGATILVVGVGVVIAGSFLMPTSVEEVAE